MHNEDNGWKSANRISVSIELDPDSDTILREIAEMEIQIEKITNAISKLKRSIKIKESAV